MLTRILILTILVTNSTAAGATFVLSSGGAIHGRLLNPDESPREKYAIQLETGGTITLDRTLVARISTKAEDLAWYREWLPKVLPTVEGHWKMAVECKTRSLDEQQEFHLEEIVKLDPDHVDAHHALGYSRVDDQWVKMDEWNRRQGYVRYRGSWRIPQDVALEQAANATELKVKGWKLKLKNWRTWVERPRGRQKEAIDAIRSIKEQYAVPALVDLVKDPSAQRELRLLATDVLTTLPSHLVVPTLVDRALKDPDPAVRDACVDGLARLKPPQAVQILKRHLKSRDNKLVNRAGACLGALESSQAALALMDALDTTHEFVIQTGGGPGQYNTGFGSGPGGGGNSFSAGGKPKRIKRQLRNEGVLNALVTLFPGTNFGYDTDAWKAWYVDQHRPVAVDLRREP